MIGLVEELMRQHLMSEVYKVAMQSNDPDTHIGAVIVPP